MEIVVKLPRLHEGQRRVLDEARRWNVLACGRRWGKTVLGRDLALRCALEGGLVAWGAPGYRYMSESYRVMRRSLGPLVLACTEEKRIELVGGGVVDFWSLNDKDAGRGFKYHRWIIDEAAMVKNLGAVFMEAVRPTLSDFQGDAWFLSTPKGRGFFWQAFGLGSDELEPDWQSWQMPSHVNPLMSSEEIEAAREMLPERVFCQEYLAEFVEDEERVFRGVREAVDVGRSSGSAFVAGRLYQAGVDLARVRDFTVVTVVDDEGRQVWFERVRGLSWERQVALVARVCSAYGCPAVVDATGVGDPVVERLRSAGVAVVPFKFSALSKQALMENLALRLEAGELRLMDLGVQTAELEGFEYSASVGGGVRMSAPSGGHDDCVCALALAVWGGGRRVRLEVF